MLVGRAADCERVDALLGAARRSSGGALVVRGPPGIGKSALLAYARSRADGMQVLTATGVESEALVPFAALAALLRPLCPRLADLAPEHAAALNAALSLAPVSGERFTVGLATLELLSLAADDAPICVLVDDAQWLEPASLDALLFAARRLWRDPVAMLIAARDDEHADLDVPGVSQLVLGGLDAQAGRTLLEELLRRPVHPATARNVVAATDGNPLALVELSRMSGRGRLTDLEAVEAPLPVGPEIQRAFTRRLAVLPAPSRRALCCAAVTESFEITEIAELLRRLGLDPEALAAAEVAGLVTIDDGEVHFAHPLLRAVAYHSLAPAERRAAHLALAEVIAAGSPRIRRAWHLAMAAIEADEGVAAELEAAAAEARAAAARASAGAAMRKAAQISMRAPDRVRRLMQGAGDFHLAGRPAEGVAMLDAAAQHAGDPLVLADIEHLRIHLTLLASPCVRTRDALVARAAAIEAMDGVRAAAMLLDAAMVSVMAGQPRAALELARRARPHTERADDALRERADYCLGVGLLLCGEGPAGDALLDRPQRLGSAEDLVVNGYHAVHAAQLNSWRERHGDARERLERLVDRARREGVLTVLPYALAGIAEAAFHLGEWNVAYAAASESVALAEEVGQSTELAHSLVRLAHVEAGQGREAACRDHVDRAMTLARQYEIGSIRTLAGTTLGMLELGLGHPEEAIAVLRPTGRFSLANGLCEPGVSMWAADLAEAHARRGSREQAEELVGMLESHATANRRSAALAAVARLQGLLAGPDEFAERYREALAWHERVPLPFEVARTRLCFGESLRRARQRKAARTELRAAHEAFKRLGAPAWAQRAHAELRAAGEATPPEGDASWELTPQELQVALLVSEGATNREVAAALYLSPKTVEVHLTHAYRKLRVRSRTELARVLGRTGTHRN